MEENLFTLIADTGIHLEVIPLELKKDKQSCLYLKEENINGNIDLSIFMSFEDEESGEESYYNIQELEEHGFWAKDKNQYNIKDYRRQNISNYSMDSVENYLYNIDKKWLTYFENKWIPLPYFKNVGDITLQKPYNWARIKLCPTDKEFSYNAILAFDTKTDTKDNDYIIFTDKSAKIQFELCRDILKLKNFACKDFINKYIRSLFFQNDSIWERRGNSLDYIKSYICLIHCIAHKTILPKIELYRNTSKESYVDSHNVDIAIDIGNSKTTVLLTENFKSQNFTEVEKLRLIDYTDIIKVDEKGRPSIKTYDDSFDMRLAFRKVDFGRKIDNEKKFIYSSFIRLGAEANRLVHLTSMNNDTLETLSTYSSPKRYLWDSKESNNEWKFLILDNEEESGHVLEIKGISEYINSDGSFNEQGEGNIKYNYSRKTLMTFAFMEIISQAMSQINSHEYRTRHGNISKPRTIKNILVTCPTAMSKKERQTLERCALDAVKLLQKSNTYAYFEPQIIPKPDRVNDYWYYDESTCAQFVYIFGELYKYGNNIEEFFNIYGKQDKTVTIGSLDIGAGTADLMISKYSISEQEYIKQIIPQPLFYDSFYGAGDEMLKKLIFDLLYSESGLFATKYSISYQKLKDSFGPDYSGLKMKDKIWRRDFNVQYAIPLANKVLDYFARNKENCNLSYKEIFEYNYEPNEFVQKKFKDLFGLDLHEIVFEYKREKVEKTISLSFTPLLKQVSAIMYSFACDIVILSGRPVSLSPLREIVVHEYPTISPSRIIVLNNYYIGDWYPFANNTGCISDAKTVVSMGALIGYYSNQPPRFNFIINRGKLINGLSSTIKYIKKDHVDVFNPDTFEATINISKIPCFLDIKQINMEQYPSRTLFSININRNAIREKFKDNAAKDGIDIGLLEQKEIQNLENSLPLTIDLEKDHDDIEDIRITSITDKNGKTVDKRYIDIHIQSLNIEQYWLDSGIFEF